jgi:hypothetical protein
MRCKYGTGILPVTGKMPIPQVSSLKEPQDITQKNRFFQKQNNWVSQGK